MKRKIDRRLLYSEMINNYPRILLLAYESDFTSVKAVIRSISPIACLASPCCMKGFLRNMELEQKNDEVGAGGAKEGTLAPLSHASSMFWSRSN